MTDQVFPPDTTVKPRRYLEKIGDTNWELEEAALDVFNEVTLWNENPRLMTELVPGSFESEEELEALLRGTRGYDNLRKSIEQIGQMEPVYAWRANDKSKYVVFEGATRITILRELERARLGTPDQGRYSRVKAKVLPPNFDLKERVILLARIHVRGTGVRSWGRYIEAKFIHDHVIDKAGQPALMSVSDMAKHMEKSISWVQRLRDAYQFALRFVEHIDDPAEGARMAGRWFSTLEEISKAATIGPQLRDYKNKEYDTLRSDVFEMVRNNVFTEYRDARFLKQFHDDPEKWAALKSGEAGIAKKLALDVRSTTNNLKVRISGLDQAVARALERDDHGLDEEDADSLRRAMWRIQERVHEGIEPFRIGLKEVAKHLSSATLANVKSLPASEYQEFRAALEYFTMLIEKYGPQR